MKNIFRKTVKKVRETADDAKGGTVHMFYLTPEEKNRLEHVPFICKENPDA